MRGVVGKERLLCSPEERVCSPGRSLMLVSHRHRFIYLKTRKTAGTSVEVLFERECVPEGAYEGPSHDSMERVTPAGIVGSREGGKRPTDRWRPHKPAAEVRAQLGDDTWNAYLKFCVIRNPFDKLVSRWWWVLPGAERDVLATCPFEEVRSAFNQWAMRNIDARDLDELGFDREIYTIGGEPCVDRFLRYEALWEDITRLCGELGIVRDRAELGTYKMGTRRRPEPFVDYYEARVARSVSALFDWEVERFGYRCG